jgi:Tol biopolymer transport system component
MPDVREVFQMSTQKVRPDRGFTQRQEFRQRRQTRNRKIGAFAVAAAIAVVAVIAIASVRDGENQAPVPGATASPSADGPRTTTHAYLDIATGERSLVPASMADARLIEVSPDGESAAYSSCCNGDPLVVAKLDGSGAEIITPDELDGYDPTWIDDETILFQGRPRRTDELGDLYVADLATGELTMVTDLPDQRNGAWIIVSDVSPDGTTVVYHLPRGKIDNTKYDLWTAPLSGGEPTLLRRNAGWPQYTADGSIVFIDKAIPFYGHGIWVMNGDGSNARPIVEDPEEVLTWPQVSPDGSEVAYGHGGKIEVVTIDEPGSTVATGEVSDEPTWFDDETLIVT